MMTPHERFELKIPKIIPKPKKNGNGVYTVSVIRDGDVITESSFSGDITITSKK